MVSANFSQPNLFRYILTTSSISEEVLEFSPDEWSESSISIKKDMKDFFSNKREFSLPLGFTKLGRKLLKDEYLTNGVNGFSSIRIEILNESTRVYELFYEGNVDFMKANLDSNFMEVNFLDNDIQSKKEAFEDTEFEIAFTAQTLGSDYDIRLPRIQMLENVSYFLYNQIDGASPNWSAWGLILGMTLNESNVRLASVFFKDQANERKGSNNYDPASYPDWNQNFFAQSFKVGLEFEINMSMLYDCTNYIGGSDICGFRLVMFEVWWDNEAQTYAYTSDIFFDFVNAHGNGTFVDKTINISRTYTTLSDNSYLYLTLQPKQERRPPSGQNMSVNIKESIFKLKYLDETKEGTRAAGKEPYYLFRDLFRKITGNSLLNVQSNFLQNNNNLLITSGDCIRRINGAVIKTSFSEFWKAISSVYDLGFDIINGVPTIEEKSYFMNENNLIENLGESIITNISTPTDLIYKEIRAGYEKEDYETELGRQEVNNGQTWTTPVSKGKNSLDLVSPYRADAYGINEIREKVFYNPNRNDTEVDSSSDDDVFMLYFDPETYEPAYQTTDNSGPFPVVRFFAQSYEILTLEGLTYSGIDQNDLYFNFMLTPKRNLLRHSRLIATSMYGDVNQNKNLVMTKSDKWRDLDVIYEGLSFSEQGNILVSSIYDPYFLPFEITIEAAFPRGFYNNYKNNSNGYVVFSYNGKEFKMYITNIEFDVARRSNFEVTGFLLPSENLQDLFN